MYIRRRIQERKNRQADGAAGFLRSFKKIIVMGKQNDKLLRLIDKREAMSKTVGKSSPQTGKWKSKEFRAFQGRKSHSAVDPAPEKGIEQVDQAERRSCLAER